MPFQPPQLPVFDAVRRKFMDLLVLQSTPFCNLDCSYCYLPGRSDRRRMSAELLERIFAVVLPSPFVGPRLTTVWHAGEPLTLGVDYWEAERRGTVTNNYQDTVNRFFGKTPSGAAAPGGLLPGESVALFSNGDIRTVNSVFFNIGETKVAGFDYSANYLWRTDRLGRFEFSTVWSMYSHYRIRSTEGGPFVEVVNQATSEGTGSDNGYLRKKGRAQVDWSYKGFSTVLATTYTDGFWDLDLDRKSTRLNSSYVSESRMPSSA